MPSVLLFRRALVAAAMLLLLPGFALPDRPVGESRSPGEFLVQTVGAGRDIREQTIYDLLPARDGYLWLGTSLGLVRFDGVNFTNFALQGAAGAIADAIATDSLWEDGGGVVWAGTMHSGVLRYDHGRFSRLTTRDGLPANDIDRVDGDSRGAVWVYSPGGVVRVDGDRVERIDPLRTAAGSGTELRFEPPATSDAMMMGRWRRTADGVERFAYGQWRPFPLPPGRVDGFSRDLRNIYEDGLHRVWFALLSERGSYFCLDGATLRTYRGVPPDAFVSYQDREGYLWLTDHGGHTARWKDGLTLPLAPVSTPFFVHVAERADGSFWTASRLLPLTLLRPHRITTLPTSGAPEVGAVLFRSREGEVWAGGVGLQRLAHGALVPVAATSHGAPFTYTRALGEDTAGHLLFSNRNTVNMRQLTGTAVAPHSAYPGVADAVQLLLLDRTHAQWIGTDKALLLVRPDGPTATATAVYDGSVICLVETAPGHIWAGTGKGPVEFRDGAAVPAATAWPFGAVLSLAVDPDGSLWAGTAGSGLVLIRNGRFHRFSQADGLPTDVVGTVQSGDPHSLWLKTDAGLLRVERSSLEKRLVDNSSELRFRRFDTTDGLPSNLLLPFGNQGSLAFPDGTLWFSTSGGIASIQPESLPRSSATPHTRMEEHAIDRSGLDSGAPVVLHPGADSVELHYTGLGSDEPSALKFRYRLEGIDSGWVEAGERRVAYYTHLPPGTYRFRVEAANADGDRWDTPGAETTLRVLAPWYRTTWFRALAAGTLLLLIVLLLWRRQRRDTAALRLRQAFTRRLLSSQETERKRIAHDLHDGLGQHLALISNLAQLPRREELSAFAKNRFALIQDEAGNALREVEGISYNLRPYQLERLGLTRAVLSLVRSLQETSEMELLSEVDNIDDVIPKDLEINFYRIVQEALSNVTRHSGASRVNINIVCSATEIRMSIQDNGVGFDSGGTADANSLGLVSIAERAELLGGSASVESSATGGTTVRVRLLRPAASEPAS